MKVERVFCMRVNDIRSEGLDRIHRVFAGNAAQVGGVQIDPQTFAVHMVDKVQQHICQFGPGLNGENTAFFIRIFGSLAHRLHHGHIHRVARPFRHMTDVCGNDFHAQFGSAVHNRFEGADSALGFVFHLERSAAIAADRCDLQTEFIHLRLECSQFFIGTVQQVDLAFAVRPRKQLNALHTDLFCVLQIFLQSLLPQQFHNNADFHAFFLHDFMLCC